jgi:hypothetical protein
MKFNISHIPYIFSIILFKNKIETFIFYLIFIMNNYNIKYKNKIITKLLIFINCYKNNFDYLKLFFLTSIASEKYEKIIALSSCFYYFYSNLILSLNYFYTKTFISYVFIGSNINIHIVYNIHFKLFMNSDLCKEITLQNYMLIVDFIKNLFLCVYLIY